MVLEETYREKQAVVPSEGLLHRAPAASYDAPPERTASLSMTAAREGALMWANA